MAAYNPSAYKISTITATGRINTCVDLASVFTNIAVVPSAQHNGILYVELGNDCFRGTPKKIRNKRKPGIKMFDNQATLLLFIDGFYANCKVFKNGCVQLTGLRRTEHGPLFIQHIIDRIHDIRTHADPNVVTDGEHMAVMDYRVRLINTDFNAGIEIRRDALFTYMMHTYPGIYSVFEPCIYSGVKIHYYHNDGCGDGDGVCRCTAACNGRGRGHGDGDCKKITIAVFRSGSVLVTGGSEYKQIDDAYAFICSAMKNCATLIHKEITVEPDTSVKKRLVSASKGGG